MRIATIIVCAFAALGACSRDAAIAPIWGNTMGTQYGVQFGQPLERGQRAALEAGIAADLARIDERMSNWRDDSELSRFNAHRSTDWFEVSEETAGVVAAALGISRLSAGAFDVTAAPLIELWGFGPAMPRRALPDADAIDAALAHVGYGKLQVREQPPALRKTDPQVVIDLSAIAKGYAVDVLARRVAAAGLQDFLVDIGGEICARGVNASGAPWTLAVETVGIGQSLPTMLRPGHRCVATSGDYRNFFEIEGERYAHVIDPRQGRPVAHRLASVTVVADDAMTADAWATALLVAGPEAGLELAERLTTAAFFMTYTDDGLARSATSAFERFEYRP